MRGIANNTVGLPGARSVGKRHGRRRAFVSVWSGLPGRLCIRPASAGSAAIPADAELGLIFVAGLRGSCSTVAIGPGAIEGAR